MSQTKTLTKTSFVTTVAAAAILAVSSTALLVSWGMVMSTVPSVRKTVQNNQFRIAVVLENQAISEYEIIDIARAQGQAGDAGHGDIITVNGFNAAGTMVGQYCIKTGNRGDCHGRINPYVIEINGDGILRDLGELITNENTFFYARQNEYGNWGVVQGLTEGGTILGSVNHPNHDLLEDQLRIIIPHDGHYDAFQVEYPSIENAQPVEHFAHTILEKNERIFLPTTFVYGSGNNETNYYLYEIVVDPQNAHEGNQGDLQPDLIRPLVVTPIVYSTERLYYFWFHALNESLELVGSVGFWDGEPLSQTGFLWSNGTFQTYGSFPNARNFAVDINNHSQVIGNLGTQDYKYQAIEYIDGKPTLLRSDEIPGITESLIYDINDAGQAVGRFNYPGLVNKGPFIYDQKHGLRDLNTLVNSEDWVIQEARLINSLGQIIAFGVRLRDGHRHVLMLNPLNAAFQRGDANGNGSVNLTDPIYTLNWLFSGGPEPPCLDAADADDSGILDINDPVYILNWLFLNGPIPDAPGPFGPDIDPTIDELRC